MRIWLIALVLCFASPQAWGCSNDAPKIDANTFIEQADRIVLAKVTSAKFVQEMYWGLNNSWGNLIEYTFNIIDPIKGEVQDNEITYKGRPVAHSREIYDFKKHSDQTFWNSIYAGRTIDNCFLPIESFVVGVDYLLIGDLNDNYPKRAELILDKDDKWLAYVREQVKEQQGND